MLSSTSVFKSYLHGIPLRNSPPLGVLVLLCSMIVLLLRRRTTLTICVDHRNALNRHIVKAIAVVNFEILTLNNVRRWS